RGERVVMEPGDALSLGLHHDRALAQLILGRNPARATIGVAGLRLHATQRKHESARDVAPVRPPREDPRPVEARDDAAACTEAHGVAQAGTGERVVRENQALAQRRPDVIGKLERRRAGPALLAVDHDEIRANTGFQYCFTDRHELPGMPDAELEAD